MSGGGGAGRPAGGPGAVADGAGLPAAVPVALRVNGAHHAVAAAPNELLVERLRDGLGLTGTKVGCDTGQCGTCLVRLDGLSVKSCLLLTVQADGRDVATVEGAADGGPGSLGPVQEALAAEHGTQCGFCAPGLVMALGELRDRTAGGGAPREAEVREWLTGNLCRCTGYAGVVRGALRACGAGADGDGVSDGRDCDAGTGEGAGAAGSGAAESGADRTGTGPADQGGHRER